jgi:non-ribosomal peptide synthetase component E (peptide arylation enzyme)
MDLERNLIGRINIGDSLTTAAAARPGQLALVDGGRTWTYRALNG